MTECYNSGMYENPQIDHAHQVAQEAFIGQTRKISGEPAVSHAEAVTELLESAGVHDQSTLVAAMLHDVLEDAPHIYPRELMLAEFGPEVVKLVEHVSEQKTDEHNVAIGWEERKKAYIEHLANAPEAAVLISAADKVHNLSTLLDDYARDGESVWASFKASPARQYWYYSTLNTLIGQRIGPDHPLAMRLSGLCSQLREIVPDQRPA